MGLPLKYWKALRLLAEPFELMKFTLIYDGDLPAGEKKRAVYASHVRNSLHDQMADLWDSHVILRQLERTARVPVSGGQDIAVTNRHHVAPSYDYPVPPVPVGYIDLCGTISLPCIGEFKPLIRKSLSLACAIDILFLRHEEPLHLFEAGGDLDNRIKTFFDGLKIPNAEAARQGHDLTASPLFCVLEDDSLISDFSVRTGRLLGRGEKRRHAVRIQAEVTVKVLRVTDDNQCLIGA